MCVGGIRGGGGEVVGWGDERYLCCIGNTLPRSHLSSPLFPSSLLPTTLPPSSPPSPPLPPPLYRYRCGGDEECRGGSHVGGCPKTQERLFSESSNQCGWSYTPPHRCSKELPPSAQVRHGSKPWFSVLELWINSLTESSWWLLLVCTTAIIYKSLTYVHIFSIFPSPHAHTHIHIHTHTHTHVQGALFYKELSGPARCSR